MAFSFAVVFVFVLVFVISPYELSALLRLVAARRLGLPRLQAEQALRNPISGDYNFEQWSKAFVSQPVEYSYKISREEVDVNPIPSSFKGTLIRNMPALFERGGREYSHYLDGDGYCVKLSFDGQNGDVTFTSRFVRTEEYVKEAEANKVLFRSTFRTQRTPFVVGDVCLNNAFDLRLKNLANTNVVYWGGRLFTLYEAGVPIELDPRTLDTRGEYDMGLGRDALHSGMSVLVPEMQEKFPAVHNALFGASMTAHPKIEHHEDGDRLVGWTWRAEVSPNRSPLDTRPMLSIYEWDSQMKTAPPTQHRLESTTVAPHDFSLTSNYYVFVENRLSGDVTPYLFGMKCPAECVGIEPKKDMILNLVPRTRASAAAKAVGSVHVPLTPGFTIHSVCAWERDSKLTLLTTAWESETVKSGKVKGGLLGSWEGRAPSFENIPVTLLYETIVDLTTQSLVSHRPFRGMEETIIEHPHINPRFEGKPVRFAYMSVGSQTGVSSPPLGYLRLDLETGDKQIWMAPLHTYCEEVVVVPKQDDSVGGAEDDVWVVATMLDATKNKTCVCIFDGRDIAAGPVSRVWLQHHLPHSLHGCFSKEVF